MNMCVCVYHLAFRKMLKYPAKAFGTCSWYEFHHKSIHPPSWFMSYSILDMIPPCAAQSWFHAFIANSTIVYDIKYNVCMRDKHHMAFFHRFSFFYTRKILHLPHFGPTAFCVYQLNTITSYQYLFPSLGSFPVYSIDITSHWWNTTHLFALPLSHVVNYMQSSSTTVLSAMVFRKNQHVMYHLVLSRNDENISAKICSQIVWCLLRAWISPQKYPYTIMGPCHQYPRQNASVYCTFMQSCIHF